MGDVVRLTEPMVIAECFGENNECIISPHCRLANILNSGLKLFLTHLDNYTLADLLNAGTQKILYRIDMQIQPE